MDEETKQLIIGMAKNLESLDAKTDAVSLQIESMQFDMDSGFATVDEQFARVDGQFNGVHSHLDGLIKSYSKFDVEDAAMLARQDRLETRVEILERKLR